MEPITIRPATEQDFLGIVELARRSLGWSDDDTRFLKWKHVMNPFGESLMLVAVAGTRLAGFRAFLRWDFRSSEGQTVPAVRAVDTATDPDFQGQGVFTRLTLAALDELAARGVAFVFNTPNEKSLAGYLKMGWRNLGRLPVAVRPARLRFVRTGPTAREGAARSPVPTTAGQAASEVLTHTAEIERLLRVVEHPAGLATRHTAASLAWRYGYAPLGYRVLLVEAEPQLGMAVFRLRPRGRAVEAVICETLVPYGDRRLGRTLMQQIANLAAPDYLIRLSGPGTLRDGFARLPHLGPVLAYRPVEGSSKPPVQNLALTMGDVELL
jgi:GNAT superfamily N-acetyltransferase